MKKQLAFLLSGLCSVLSFQCADHPVMPTPATEDISTYTTAYQGQTSMVAITTNEANKSIPFYLSGTGGKIMINWGDGKVEKLTINGHVAISHDYDSVRNYNIQFSGDLVSLTSFEIGTTASWVRSIDFSKMINLKEVGMGLIDGPSVLNFSHNRSLKTVSLVSVHNLNDLILPPVHKIETIDITGKNDLPTAVVDKVISRVYDSVVAHPRAGTFTLYKDWADGGMSNDMVGPPSSYSINKLRKLRDVYGWTIFPAIN